MCADAARLAKFQCKLEKDNIVSPAICFRSDLVPTAADVSATGNVVPCADRNSALLLPEVVSPQSVEWLGQPVATTLTRLLTGRHDRLADQLRRDFHLSDRRFALASLLALGLAVRLSVEPAVTTANEELTKLVAMKKPPFTIEASPRPLVTVQLFNLFHLT
ncbi:unnamed protein product [Protopolystoma xenopodis]|uniref:Uncharacterized protein n=1 Tax=Protopolystoma xenopodis TaxID=117903 RepID=A0A448X6L9_9PLAT|nr:unnamed protein product [Protopolystoma xenopodis]